MLGRWKERAGATPKRYHGRLIFEAADRMGLMEVVDDANLRALHFGTPEKQSAMNLNAHHELVLSYTRAMIAGLLFTNKPVSILNAGLGGGSLPKFFLHFYPECQVDVVEIREKVVELAHDYFHLPRDPRLNIFICDIREYFHTVKTKCYDLIFLDVYNKDGLSDSAKAFSFMNVCKSRLNPGGVMIANLWSEPETLYKKLVYNIFKCFGSHVAVLPVSDRSNHIAIGINQQRRQYQEDQLKKRSRILEQAFQIGLPDMCTTLCEYNHRLFGKPT